MTGSHRLSGNEEPPRLCRQPPGPGAGGAAASSVVLDLLDVDLAVQLEEALGARPAAPGSSVLLLAGVLLLLLAGQLIPAGLAVTGPGPGWLRHRGAGGGPARHHLGGRRPGLGARGPLRALLGPGAKAAEAVESLAVLQGQGERGS